MSKLILAVSALVFAASANAGGWRALQIDGSDEASFNASVAAFQGELPWVKGRVFEMAMQDIWKQGVERARDEQREYTGAEYFQLLDGLGYKEILSLADPSGGKTKQRYRAERALWKEYLVATRLAQRVAPPPNSDALSSHSQTQRTQGFTGASMNVNNQGYPNIWPTNHP